MLFTEINAAAAAATWKDMSLLGGRAPEDVILELIHSKCLPALLYGLEACPLRKSDVSSLDFVVNRFFMKLFQTNNTDIVNYCRAQCDFYLPSTVVEKR